ncbi:MAG TPA: 6,7-dimethyl-8-ribityllumazine synthase [Nannocystis sp.]
MAELPVGVKAIEGSLDAKGLRLAIVVSRFNSFITERLLEGAVDALVRSGARPEDITVVRCPGAWEIPMVVGQVLSARSYDAVITLGCLIRGDTVHFDLIAAEVSRGVSQMALAFEVPVTFGVLTTDTLEQAINRAGAKAGNKGAEAAMAAVEQARLYRAIAADGAAAAQSESSGD